MRALVLSGGKGTRLRPLTHTGAKQLVPIANKPIIFYVIDNIADIGITEIGIVISPETGAEVRQVVGDGSRWGVTISYITQDYPGGLAHAVQISSAFLQQEPFVLYLGDNMIGTRLTAIYQDFCKSGADAAILLKEVSNPSAFGVAVIDESQHVVELVEKPEHPPSNLALVGIYFFRSRVLEVIDGLSPSERGELEITDAIAGLLASGGKISAHIIDAWWLDTGKKDDLLYANTTVLDDWQRRDVLGKVSADSQIIGRVGVATDASIINSTIRGPVVIGPGTVVTNSFIGPFSAIGANCRITNSVIENGVIMADSRVENIDRLEDFLIGSRVKVCRSPSQKSHRLLVGDDSVVEI